MSDLTSVSIAQGECENHDQHKQFRVVVFLLFLYKTWFFIKANTMPIFCETNIRNRITRIKSMFWMLESTCDVSIGKLHKLHKHSIAKKSVTIIF